MGPIEVGVKSNQIVPDPRFSADPTRYRHVHEHFQQGDRKLIRVSSFRRGDALHRRKKELQRMGLSGKQIRDQLKADRRKAKRESADVSG